MQSGNDQVHFDTPSGVAVTASAIYVADTRNHRVQVYDRAYVYQATIGVGWGDGNDQFKDPVDVAIDDAGNVYVVDTGNIRVQQFDSSYVHQRTFGTTGVPYVTDGEHFNDPAGLAINPTDGSIYLAEARGHCLVKLDASDDLVWTVGEPGVKGGDNTHFIYPQDVALDDSGAVYVVDTYNHRVQIYDAGGVYSDTLGSWGSGDYQFDRPHGLTISPDGLIYVADSGNHRVQIFDASLNYVDTLGTPGSGDFYFEWPEDVAVDTRGYVYVADAGGGTVVAFDGNAGFDHIHNFQPRTSSYTSFSYPCRLATDLADNLYVVDKWPSRVYRFHLPTFYAQDVIGEGIGDALGELDAPYGVAIGTQGGLYVGDQNNQRIQEFIRSKPVLVGNRPISDVVDVPTYRWVSVTFDDAMDPASLNDSTFRLYEDGTSPVAGNVSYVASSRMAIFQPDVALAPSTRYVAHVTTGVRSAYGKSLEEWHTWSFTTGDGQPQLDDGMHFFFGDLHSHSRYSDGQGMPEEAFATARANGLDFYALTDHAFQLTLSEWEDMGVQADAGAVRWATGLRVHFEHRRSPQRLRNV